MRILCEFSPNGPAFVRNGWRRVFEYLGHKFYWWRQGQEAVHDAFAKADPVSIFLGTTYNTDRAVVKCVQARPNLKVGLFCSAWGPLVNKIDRKQYPIDYRSENEIRIIEGLYKTCQKPDFVFLHLLDKRVDEVIGGWNSIGVKPVGIMNAADTFVYLNGKKQSNLESDFCFIGNNWSYKSRNINRFLLPLFSSDLTIRIHGTGGWNGFAQYLGAVSDELVKDIFASAKICPNISEPHSTTWGYDIVERVLKVPCAGGFLISDYVKDIDDVFGPNVVPMAKTPEEFKDIIYYYLEQPELRQEIIDKTKKIVLERETYFDRVAKMMTNFGMEKEAGRCLDKKKELLNENVFHRRSSF